MVVDSEFSVLFWSKALVLDLGQAEQKDIPMKNRKVVELGGLFSKFCFLLHFWWVSVKRVWGPMWAPISRKISLKFHLSK